MQYNQFQFPMILQSMKKSLILFVGLFTIIFNNVNAQNVSPDNPDTNGLYLGASLLGTAWNTPDSDVDSESGGGIGLKLGYNFNTNIAAFFSVDGSVINPEQGEDYALAHADLGIEGRLGNYDGKLRPFARLSYLGMSAQSDENAGDFEINGTGIGLGGGLYYFATNNFALELGYTHSWVNINEVKVGSSSADVDEDARTGRLSLGASYHF